MTKNPSFWRDVKLLFEYTLREMEKMKDVITDDQNKSDMKANELYVVMHDVEDTGNRIFR